MRLPLIVSSPGEVFISSEEEKDFEKIMVRDEFYKFIVEGYNEEMKDQLTEAKKNHFSLPESL